jgi:hypothetical protein
LLSRPPTGEVVISMRPVFVFANGPDAEAEQLRAELRGRWRQAARAMMVLLSLRGLRVTNRTFGMLLRSGFPAGHHHADTSSAWTSMDSSSGPPNVVAMATSEASRPRPITTRPFRPMLLRGSNVHH